MKILTMILGVMLSMSILNAAAFEKVAKARGAKAYISSEKPLSVGSNTFKIKILKKSKTVSDAKVSVKLFMPAMPGMPAMSSLADAK